MMWLQFYVLFFIPTRYMEPKWMLANQVFRTLFYSLPRLSFFNIEGLKLHAVNSLILFDGILYGIIISTSANFCSRAMCCAFCKN